MSADLIDTHIHLGAPDFEEDLDQVLDRSRQAGVVTFVCVGAGYGAESARKAVEIADRYPDVFATVGIHPNDASATPFDTKLIADLASHPKVVAIGETGFEFHWKNATREDQDRWFRYQVELALELEKPIIIHSREAATECLAVLKELGAKSVGGVFHCYSEDSSFAEKLREINFLISVPGNVTFKKAQAMRDAVRDIPLSQIMLETDAPYLAPEPYRGKRCDSSLMVETARVVAELKGVSYEALCEETSKTARNLFKFPSLKG